MRSEAAARRQRSNIFMRQFEALAIIVSVGIGLYFILFREQLVPAHFQFDSNKIQEGAQGRVYDDYTFDTVSSIYRFLGLADSPDLAGILGYGLFVITLLVAMRRTKGTPTLYRILVVSIAAVLAGIYLGGFSKDAFVLLIVLAVLIAGGSRAWDVLVIAIMVWYGVNFRQYWLLIAVGYVAFRIVQRRPLRARWLLIWLAVGIVIISVGFWFVLDIAPDTYRTRVNEVRLDVASSTMIQPFVDGVQPLAGIVNNLLTALVLLFPLPLVFIGEIYYVAIAALLLVVWGGFLVSASRFGRNQRLVDAGNVVTVRAISLVLAFVMVQSLFEPDYGSALRHLIPLLPLMIAVGTVRFASSGTAESQASQSPTITGVRS
ncbi:hypothetical protein ASD19_06910 [Microbacterium sp. Root53]|uniref:hypothetical protein n=1 Tax=Microbacterium sp. Root53 TaxID=1736553 RepID=UPI0006FCB428|nr:hypothetical protein [Microbacterium sp. Root53]KQY98561.1 hypothetical protein ASD19_06910 [Microbacterium sp. Root53]